MLYTRVYSQQHVREFVAVITVSINASRWPGRSSVHSSDSLFSNFRIGLKNEFLDEMETKFSDKMENRVLEWDRNRLLG